MPHVTSVDTANASVIVVEPFNISHPSVSTAPADMKPIGLSVCMLLTVALSHVVVPVKVGLARAAFKSRREVKVIDLIPRQVSDLLTSQSPCKT